MAQFGCYGKWQQRDVCDDFDALRALIIEAGAIAQAEQLGVADSRRAYHHADAAVSVKARATAARLLPTHPDAQDRENIAA
jgi:hypothetical protein